MQDRTKESWRHEVEHDKDDDKCHERKEECHMHRYQDADDAHFKATVPWWMVWGNQQGCDGRYRGGMGTTGMILGIIAIVIIVLFFFGWIGSNGYGWERGPYNGHYNGYHNGAYPEPYGYHHGGGLSRANYYQDKYYEAGDKLAVCTAEKYADHVAWKMLDKANDYTNRELGHYARYNSVLQEKDQQISRLYTDRLFDRCVKEVPNMVCSKQIVAPVGPVVRPAEFEMVNRCHRDCRCNKCDNRGGHQGFAPYGGGYGGFNPPYPYSGANYPGLGFPGQLPVIPPVVTTPASVPVTLYPQPLVTTTTP
jgi:hypothetical protein